MSCRNMCWIAGALLGLAAFLLLLKFGVFLGLIGGLVIGVALVFILQGLFCSDVGASAPVASEPAPAPKPAPEPVSEPEAAPEPVATSEPEPKPEPQPESAAEDAEEVVAVEAPADAPEAAPVAADDARKPETLDAPRGGVADDLKRLKGVGPKLEGMLNGLGFWHFDQIAAWGPEEIAWVDDNLSFKGRIERDGWVEQAKALAAEKGQG